MHGRFAFETVQKDSIQIGLHHAYFANLLSNDQ